MSHLVSFNLACLLGMIDHKNYGKQNIIYKCYGKEQKIEELKALCGNTIYIYYFEMLKEDFIYKVRSHHVSFNLVCFLGTIHHKNYEKKNII